jgi:hypothetical protein
MLKRRRPVMERHARFLSGEPADEEPMSQEPRERRRQRRPDVPAHATGGVTEVPVKPANTEQGRNSDLASL